VRMGGSVPHYFLDTLAKKAPCSQWPPACKSLFRERKLMSHAKYRNYTTSIIHRAVSGCLALTSPSSPPERWGLMSTTVNFHHLFSCLFHFGTHRSPLLLAGCLPAEGVLDLIQHPPTLAGVTLSQHFCLRLIIPSPLDYLLLRITLPTLHCPNTDTYSFMPQLFTLPPLRFLS